MIIDASKASEVACPLRAADGKTLRCLGSKCAFWRWASYRGGQGYCGGGGPVTGGARRMPDGTTAPSPHTLLDADPAAPAPAGDF